MERAVYRLAEHVWWGKQEETLLLIWFKVRVHLRWRSQKEKNKEKRKEPRAKPSQTKSRDSAHVSFNRHMMMEVFFSSSLLSFPPPALFSLQRCHHKHSDRSERCAPGLAAWWLWARGQNHGCVGPWSTGAVRPKQFLQRNKNTPGGAANMPPHNWNTTAGSRRWVGGRRIPA